MSLYTPAEEECVRTQALVHEWSDAGLLSASQRASLEGELRTDLKRTNGSLRAALFIFGTIVIWAAFGFYLVAFDVQSRSAGWFGALVWGGICFVVADRLVAQFRLYRFGIEEAFAIWSGILLSGGTWWLAASGQNRGDLPEFAALVVGAIVGIVVCVRFGYVYAAVAAVGCGAMAPFFLELGEVRARMISIAILSLIFIAAHAGRTEYGDDFPGDGFGLVQAVTGLAIYAVINLRLSLDLRETSRADSATAFYWSTYAAIWVLPAAGLYLGVREKHREMIWAGLVMALATLVTNKAYLGWARHSWDPILLGIFLIGAAIAIRRWLSSGPEHERRGFTSQSMHDGDRETLAVVSTLAGGVQPFAPHAHPPTEPSSTFEAGSGGRSGGGGGGADF